jgi:predicted MFS family arabinose efflux permease
MLILAPLWNWVIGANALLGINQGLAWSMTVNMKMDLVGPRHRGAALGFNEAAGYLAIAAAAFCSGVIAERYGVRPEPFYLGIAVAALGLGISALWCGIQPLSWHWRWRDARQSSQAAVL